ncbi:hypothetical protein ACTMU2_13020 [Cupriavidus basilensis]
MSESARISGSLNHRIILRQIQDSMSPLLLDAMPEVGVPKRLGCPVRIRGEIAAFVFVDGGEAPLGELDIRATEHAQSSQRCISSIAQRSICKKNDWAMRWLVRC